MHTHYSHPFACSSSFLSPGIVFKRVNDMRIAGCLFVMVMTFSFPQAVQSSVRDALITYAHDVIPTLYPYMVLTTTIAESLQESKHVPLWMAVLLGMLGGTPSGFSMLSFLYNQRAVNRRRLYTVSILLGTISPMFLFHTVKSWFGNKTFIILLMISHYSGAVLSSVVIHRLMRKDTSVIKNCSSITITEKASPITSCVSSVLNIGGCLVFFSVISVLFEIVFPTANKLWAAFIHSVLEISGGLKALSACFSDYPKITGIIAAACCGFSGISMISQSHLFMKSFGISVTRLLLFGLLRAAISGTVMFILISFI